jgi:hypothetical protein
MRRIGHPHLGFEAAGKQPKLVGGAAQSGVEVVGDVKRKGHRSIEELRLLLSKNDYRGSQNLPVGNFFS